MNTSSKRNTIRLVGVPEGGVTDDGDFGYVVLQGSDGTETYLAISHTGLPQLIWNLEGLNQMVRQERLRKSRPVDLEETSAKVSTGPLDLALDAESGLAILMFPHPDARPTRVAIGLEQARQLSGMLEASIAAMTDPARPKRN